MKNFDMQMPAPKCVVRMSMQSVLRALSVIYVLSFFKASHALHGKKAREHKLWLSVHKIPFCRTMKHVSNIGIKCNAFLMFHWQEEAEECPRTACV